jgi:hypothetical protein
MMDAYRAEQLRALVRWLARDAETGSVSGGAWLIPQILAPSPAGRGRGVRETWRAVVWNASPDELDSFTLRRPAAMPAPTKPGICFPQARACPSPSTATASNFLNPCTNGNWWSLGSR